MDDLQARLFKLEGETLVLRELVRALIAFVPADPVTTGAFSAAMQAVTARASQAPEEQARAARDALKALNPLEVRKVAIPVRRGA